MSNLRQVKLQISQAMPELLGLIRGDLPRFVYSNRELGNEVPVFSFHSVSPSGFRCLLDYLATNGYATISMDDMYRHLSGAKPLTGRNIVLTFDDGWSTAWSVATPLLKEFNMQATLYIAPATISEENGLRKTIEDGVSEEVALREDGKHIGYLITLQELDAMQSSGVWDIQSHTLYHTRVWKNNNVVDFVNPSLEKTLINYRPWYYMISNASDVLSPYDLQLGWPIYPDTARMIGTQRYIPHNNEGAMLVKYVSENGGNKYFQANNWRKLLKNYLMEYRKKNPGRWETREEVLESIRHELYESRKILQQRTNSVVSHLLFPWEEGSMTAIKIAKEIGYKTASWGVLRNRRSNSPGDDPFNIPRISWKFIPLLPGKGRTSLLQELQHRVRKRTRALFT